MRIANVRLDAGSGDVVGVTAGVAVGTGVGVGAGVEVTVDAGETFTLKLAVA